MINMSYSIELDCPSGFPRPGDLIAGVIAGTELENLESLKPENTTSRLFGNWIWEFDVPEEVYERAKPIIKQRIERLYYSGVIRYGSW